MSRPFRPLDILRRAAATLVLASCTPLALANDPKAAKFYEDALVRYERKDLAGAIIQLKNALQIDKTMLPVQVLLGQALLDNSDPVGAEVAFNEALRLGVSRVEVVIPLAQSLIGQGKHNQMLDAPLFELAGLPAQTQRTLLLIMTQAYTEVARPLKAQRAAEDAQALSPQTPEVWLVEVPLRLRARQFSEAMAAVDKALKLAPTSAEAHHLRGAILHPQGRLAEALSAYEKALQLDPAHTEASLARAGLLVDLGRDKEASAELSNLLSRQPNEPRALYLQALLADRKGDRQASRAALSKITALMDPVPIDFLRYRPQFLLLNGLAHFSLDEFSKAKPYLEAALRAQGPSPIAKLLARVYLAEKAPDRAVNVLKSYLRAVPEDANALTLLASIHISQGRHARATNLMREALNAKDDSSFRTMLGLSLLRGGRTADAVSSLEQAYKTDPKQIYAGTALMMLYLQAGQVRKAVDIAAALVRRQPGNASLLVLQGNTLERAADPKGARRAYESALKQVPGLLQAELGMARLDIRSGAFNPAVLRLNALQKADERNVEIMLELASLAEAQGNPQEMQRWLEKAEAVSGLQDIRPILAMVHLHLKQRQYPQALEVAKRMLPKAPDDPVVLTMLARVQRFNGDNDGARSTLGGAARRAGVEVRALLDIGELQMQVGDMSGARYSIDKVLSVEPASVRGQALMSGIELSQGEVARAEARAAQLTQSQPKLAVGHHLLADVALAKRQPAAAVEALKKAYRLEPSTISLLRLFSVQQSVEGLKSALTTAEGWLKKRPRDTVVLKAIGDAHARARAFEAARKAYERCLEVAPDDAEALNSLASVYLALNDKKALALAQQAVKLQPSNAFYIDTLGWSEYRLGQTERALPLLRDARLRNPGNAEIRLHLGEVLMKQGKILEARVELNAAAGSTQDPVAAESARKLLATLK